MDVENGLAGFGTIIKDDPEGVTNTFLAGNVSTDTHYLADNLFILCTDLSRATDMLFGNDQEVDWGLGVDVAEGKDVIILVKLVRGNITINNLAKKAVVHGEPRAVKGEIRSRVT